MNHSDLNHFTTHANYFDLWEERPYKLFSLAESPTPKDLKRKVDEIIPLRGMITWHVFKRGKSPRGKPWL